MSIHQQPDDRDHRPDPHSRGLTRAEVEELLPAFVLGALEPEEMVAVDRFVRDHPELRTRLANFESVVTELAHAAPQMPPPPRAKVDLMNRVRRELGEQQPEVSPTTPLTAPRTPLVRQVPLKANTPARPVAPPPASGPGWFTIFIRSFALAGTAAAIAILGFLSVQLRNNVQQLTAQLQAVQTEMTQLQSQNDQLAQQNIALQEQLQSRDAQYAILANPQQSIALAATGQLAATGHFYAREEQALLVLHGLQPLAADQTYQLWWLSPDGGAALPGELLTVTSGESISLNIAIPAEHRDYSGIGISIEPAGGRETPTTVVLLGKATRTTT